MDENKPVSVGLCGDGDEIAAIDEIEMTFGVTLDYSDAPTWQTAGDVFRSLQSSLPAHVANAPDTWDRFVAVLTNVSGGDAAKITPESPLIDATHPWRGLSNLSSMMAAMLIASLALVALLAFALS